MAFTFDATVGGAFTNSYISVDEADEYFAGHLDGAAWAMPLSKKHAALVQATNRIDRESFGGQLTNRLVQRLQFPRTYILSRDASSADSEFYDAIAGMYYRDPNSIPLELKQATCEMALYLLKKSSGEFTIDDNDLETLTKYKVGPLDMAIKDGIKADRLPTSVQSLLKAIGPNGWSAGQALRFTA